MPADLAIGENPDAPTVALDIGYIEDLGVLGGEILLPHVNLQIAKLATEAHKRCLVEGLISEQQQFVFRPQASDCRNVGFRGRSGELEIQHFSAEAGAQRACAVHEKSLKSSIP